jgi:hypothetical protein
MKKLNVAYREKGGEMVVEEEVTKQRLFCPCCGNELTKTYVLHNGEPIVAGWGGCATYPCPQQKN